MIDGALHERQWQRVQGGYQVSNGRHLWDWVKVEEYQPTCQHLGGKNLVPRNNVEAKALFGKAVRYMLVADRKERKSHIGTVCGVKNGIVHFDNAMSVKWNQLYEVRLFV